LRISLLGATSTTSAPYTQAAEQFLDSRTRMLAPSFRTPEGEIKSHAESGLALEVSMPWYDTQRKIQDLQSWATVYGVSLAPQGWYFRAILVFPRPWRLQKYNNIGPRLDWRIHRDFGWNLRQNIRRPGKSSIRAAYGLYYTSVEDLNLFLRGADAPFGL